MRGDNLEGLGVDRRVLLKGILKIMLGDVDWVDLAMDREKLPALVNTVMNLQVAQNAENNGGTFGFSEWL